MIILLNKLRDIEIKKLNTLLNIGVNYVGGSIIEFIVINIGINLVNGAYSMYVNNNTYEILSLIFE
ncbi:hypothetical protein, partial [Clostridium paraputrificum]|uniref:hypothetical protein n=2 Tax=Clostridiaceae TaxID=31979 RepID=UPI0034A13A41